MKRHRRKVILLAITFSIFRLGLSFATNPALEMNVDEERSWQIAQNHAAGLGYVFFDPYVNDYVPTALQNSTTTFVYQFLIAAGIPKWSWVVSIYIVTALMLGVSIWAFYLLSKLVLGGENAALAAAIAYSILPTSIYWVSRFFYYESLVVPLLVISVYLAVNTLFIKDRGVWLVPVLVAVSFALRTQVLPVLALFLTAFAVVAVYRRRFEILGPIAVSALLCGLIIIPTLVKNHGIFGAYATDNLDGYAMLNGHNPHATGSWNRTWREPDDPEYIYAHENIPGLASMNEYEESRARRALAYRFVLEHPIEDLRIEVKKLALLFAPFDYPGTPPIFDPIVLLINVPFLAMVCVRIWRRDFVATDALLLAPIAGAIAITIVFFMGVRWRYYAEPFMIIYAVMFLDLVACRVRGRLRPLPA